MVGGLWDNTARIIGCDGVPTATLEADDTIFALAVGLSATVLNGTIHHGGKALPKVCKDAGVYWVVAGGRRKRRRKRKIKRKIKRTN